MSPQKSPIEWTDYTSNPIRARRRDDGTIGWNCEKVSPGCANCYAEKINLRLGTGLRFAADKTPHVIPYLNGDELNAIRKLNASIARRRNANLPIGVSPSDIPNKLFLGDMTDIFGNWIPDEYLDEIMACIVDCPYILFQLVTKRIQRANEYFFSLTVDRIRPHLQNTGTVGWPWPNLILLTSIENQETANDRIPWLLGTAVAMHGVSYEPALGPVDFTDVIRTTKRGGKLDWIICGGESGPNARPMHPDWARSSRDQCQTAGVPFFFKQWGAWLPVGQHHEQLIPRVPKAVNGFIKIGKKISGRQLDGHEWTEFPNVRASLSASQSRITEHGSRVTEKP